MAPKPKLVVLHPVHGYKIKPAQDLKTIKRNARERNRVQTVNCGFERLRQLVPSAIADKKMSKVNILGHAVDYIQCLHSLLQQQQPMFSPQHQGMHSPSYQDCSGGPYSPTTPTYQHMHSHMMPYSPEIYRNSYSNIDSEIHSPKSGYTNYNFQANLNQSASFSSPTSSSAYSPQTPFTPSSAGGSNYSPYFNFNDCYANENAETKVASESTNDEDLLDAIADWQNDPAEL